MTTLQPDSDSTRLLDAKEVAAMLHVKTSWVYRASRRGELPCVPVGRYRRYDPEKVEAWIKGKRDAA